MNAITSAVEQLARQVLRHEAGGRREPATLAEAAEVACARLRGRLAGLIGPAGFDALLARALRLAQAERPTLRAVAFDPQTPSGLRGVRELAAVYSGDADTVAADLIAIVAHLLGLLATFIGEDLALRLAREAWPDLSADDTSWEEPA